MKSYISRKFPLATRTTGQIFDSLTGPFYPLARMRVARSWSDESCRARYNKVFHFQYWRIDGKSWSNNDEGQSTDADRPATAGRRSRAGFQRGGRNVVGCQPGKDRQSCP